ncbi:hypothetical protein N7532_003555 [Penicillium argentinense]|uniref:Uncharacterized protein n=1 Tax=Penicillium argentinense TaxID=1131581 RepID=A0A9W9FML7_9EURO|nr:uncharacterized protein N7532_003555 [Penicillium argentinense]KAJ5103026.1 hypothetical protein N7532_003555 [Penicillium argentinense]
MGTHAMRFRSKRVSTPDTTFTCSSLVFFASGSKDANDVHSVPRGRQMQRGLSLLCARRDSRAVVEQACHHLGSRYETIYMERCPLGAVAAIHINTFLFGVVFDGLQIARYDRLT